MSPYNFVRQVIFYSTTLDRTTLGLIGVFDPQGTVL
jgi:hypothetical protein